MRVRGWLTKRGIEHQLLCWVGEKPTAGIQEAARSARYRLMSRWCREAGVLHLLLGHHQQDQAETVLMRHCRGSGVDGLAGMAAVVEIAAVRLVRPLLQTSPQRLRAVLSAAGQPWIEDPSNSDPAYTRNRVRALLPRLAESGVAVPSVVTTSARMARARLTLDDAASTLLARCCHLYPDGYARFDARAMASAPDAVATRALARVLTAIGGRAYAPPTEKLERILSLLIRENSLAAATLGRCAMVRSDDGVLVCREARGLPSPQLANAEGPMLWDGRFLIDFASSAGSGGKEIRLTALGASGDKQITHGDFPWSRHRIPWRVRPSLPALADDDGILIVPHLHFMRRDVGRLPVRFRAVSFRPRQALAGWGW
jgi:tRNA(Ile)-lysidine synthase